MTITFSLGSFYASIYLGFLGEDEAEEADAEEESEVAGYAFREPRQLGNRTGAGFPWFTPINLDDL